MRKIILASSSPRRKELLKLADLSFEVLVQSVDETVDDSLSIDKAIQNIAYKKAMAVRPLVDDKTLIIAADTVVVYQNKILGKPVDKADAIQMLTSLQNQKHSVITAVCMVLGQQQIIFDDKTDVYFNPLTAEQIIYYVDAYRPYDKAGSYAIQEWIGAVGVNRIDGDYFNVMGLPINKVLHYISIIEK